MTITDTFSKYNHEGVRLATGYYNFTDGGTFFSCLQSL